MKLNFRYLDFGFCDPDPNTECIIGFIYFYQAKSLCTMKKLLKKAKITKVIASSYEKYLAGNKESRYQFGDAPTQGKKSDIAKTINKYFKFFINKSKNNNNTLGAWRVIKFKIYEILKNKIKNIMNISDVNTQDILWLLYWYVNKEQLNENEKNFRTTNIQKINMIPENAKQIINDYMNIIINNNYSVNSNDDCDKIVLYFLKIFIPIFFEWDNALNSPLISSDIIKYNKKHNKIIEFNEIMKPFRIQYVKCQYFNNYVNLFTIVNDSNKKILLKAVNFCKNIYMKKN